MSSELLTVCSQGRFKVVAVCATAWDQHVWKGGGGGVRKVWLNLFCTYFVRSGLRVGRAREFIFAFGPEMP